jgi:predicted 3-demethylubiquinone-9 3-methyltransferase (glyoxalase superfamily)
MAATVTQKITPYLWFNDDAEDAVNFYVSIFPGAEITDVSRYSDVGPGDKGKVMTMSFVLLGMDFLALNGGEWDQAPKPAFMVDCETQEEVDHYWERLSEGGEKLPCGWLRDKFGTSWNIVPTVLPELLGDPDREKAERVMKAMLQMGKLDIAALRAAADNA